MKSWYTSKTIWTNAISFIALAVQTQTGFVVDPSLQAAALAAVNVVLRSVTKEALTVLVLLVLTLATSACSNLTPELIEALSKDEATFCASSDIRGGSGALVPGSAVPMGGYGQSTLHFCRSNQPSAKISLSPDGSISIEHGNK